MADLRALSESAIDSSEQSLNSNVSKANTWKDFSSLIKIGIVNSNMITTFTGLWLALHFTNQGFLANWGIVLLTLMGSSFIIAGSCVINNVYDRDIDPLMERTKDRPTVTGTASPAKTAAFGVILIIFGLMSLLMTTISAAIIGVIGVFSYVVLYTMWSKRRYVSNTIVGSISGAVPPLIGWAAVDPNLDIIAWALFFIMFAWQPPHFYALAMRRVKEYKAAGVPMLPVVKGFETTKKHTLAWIIALFPIPFLLITSLGMPFVILATILNIGWLVLGIYRYNKRDDMKWATSMFVYSLQYMTIMFVSMVIVTLL